MAYNDEEKLNIVIEKIVQRFTQIQTWGELKVFISNITQTRVTNFIKAALQKKADSEEMHIGLFTNRKADTLELKDEL